MLWDSIQSVLTLLIMIVIGYFITEKPWFGTAGMDVCSKFCVKIAIPCYMFCNVISTCKDRQQLFQIFSKLPIPIFVIILCLGLGILLGKVLKVPKGRRGVFVNVLTFSNTVIVGFPVIIALMGEEALPNAMIYYMANTVLFWTVGIWLLRSDSIQGADSDGSPHLSINSWSVRLGNIFSPPIIGFLLGIFVILLNLEVPDFLFNSLNYIKQSTTALSMIFIGSVIRMTNLRTLRFSREMTAMVIGRFLIAPAMMFAVCLILSIDVHMKMVFCIMTIMPAMTQLGIMAKESGSDYSYASIVITMTTLISLAAIPIYMEIFSRAFGLI